MKPQAKTKSQLLQEISDLTKRLATLEAGSERCLSMPVSQPPPEQELNGELPNTQREVTTSILAAMEDGVFLIGPQQDFVYTNPVAEKEFGPVLGRKCHEYFHNRNEVCPWCEREKIVRGKSVRRIFTESKTEKIYDVFESPVVTADGRVMKLAVLHDVTQHRKAEQELKLNEVRFESLVKLGRMTDATISDIAEFALEQAVRLTGSQIGFVGFPDENESISVLHVTTRKSSTKVAPEIGSQFGLDGIWAEAVRKCRPVIVNKFDSEKFKTTVPPGFPKMERLLCVPVLNAGRVLFVAAVGNKRAAYNSADLRQCSLLMDSMSKLIQRRKDQERLRESEEQMRFLAIRLLDFLEEERARIAREIHGDIGQVLAAMKLGVENILKSAREGEIEQAIPVLESYIEMLIAGIGKARQMYMDLRPTVLDDFGVIAAIFWLCARFQEAYPSVKVEKEVQIEESVIPDHLKLPIFRVAQEALNNSAAHSRADRIRIAMESDADTLRFVFSDNGAGFDPTEILAAGSIKKGLGLATMRERTQITGGTFLIESEIGKGTLVKASWKLGKAGGAKKLLA